MLREQEGGLRVLSLLEEGRRVGEEVSEATEDHIPMAERLSDTRHCWRGSNGGEKV